MCLLFNVGYLFSSLIYFVWKNAALRSMTWILEWNFFVRVMYPCLFSSYCHYLCFLPVDAWLFPLDTNILSIFGTNYFLLQFCRYLFYLGKIRTIQLEYTDAKESLLQAARKAPVAALGFRVQCNKWAIIVRLLLGEIPERTVFMQKGMEKALRPYFELTNVSLHFSNLSHWI